MIRTEKLITAICRAKINLTLDVLDRRPDGYHNLESVMQSVDIADTLRVEVTTGSAIKITTNIADIPTGPSNTVYKACALFKDAAEVDCAVDVEIRKRIPIEAGLGGGSADAAAVLLALDQFFAGALTRAELAALAARVGSDVPFFLHGGTALITGKGEMVQPLQDAPALDLVIAKPDIGVSTSWAYNRLGAVYGRKSLGGTKRLIEAIHAGDRDRMIDALSNDFDGPISEAHPVIGELKCVMAELGAQAAILCGSGAGVLAVFEGPEAAARAARELVVDYPFVVATRTTPVAVTMGETNAD